MVHESWPAFGSVQRTNAGTLDFDIAASDLGIPLPITVRLRSAPIGGALVSYSLSWSGSVVLDRVHPTLVTDETERRSA